MYIVGKISDHSLIYTSGQISPVPSDAVILAAAVESAGGAPADFSILQIQDGIAKARRIQDGDSFALIWSGSTLSDVDFAGEESKRWIRFTPAAASFVANGVASLAVTVEIWKADKTALAGNMNSTEDIPIVSPSGSVVLLRCSFVAGSCVKPVVSSQAGRWTFPASQKRAAGFRVWGVETVDGVLAF